MNLDECYQGHGEMTLLEESHFLGVIVATVDNIHDSTGCICMRRLYRAQDALERLDNIRDVIGSAADDAYAAGFDETIDFSSPDPVRESYAYTDRDDIPF